jgi:catechol 2,3-dioxygenase-like lactoylglutathione lyase family enzyme
MADDESPPVTAEPPESPFHTVGTDHMTIWGSNEAETVAFYRDLLGMPLVLRQPNLDDPSQTHLFFDTGDGRLLSFFVSDERQSNRRPLQTEVGGVHHLCYRIDPTEFEEVMDALADAGYDYNVFDRGVFHSLYTRDPNGLVLELSADKFDVPEDRRGEVLAKAQELRVADGADYATEHHLVAALEDLGLDATPHDLPAADSGVGGVE